MLWRWTLFHVKTHQDSRNDSLSLYASLSSFAYVKTRALTDDSFQLQLVVVIFDLVSSDFQRFVIL